MVGGHTKYVLENLFGNIMMKVLISTVLDIRVDHRSQNKIYTLLITLFNFSFVLTHFSV